MNDSASLWSVDDFGSQTFPDKMGSTFYEEAIQVHDITQPDITMPLNDQDTIPTHLMPYTRENNTSVPPLQRKPQTPLCPPYHSSYHVDYCDDQYQ